MDPPLAKPPEMVLIVPRKGGSGRVISVRVGRGVCRGESLVGGVCGQIEGGDDDHLYG